jgi:primosomal replication protein N
MLPQVPLQFPNQLPIPQLQLYHHSQQESVQTMRQVGEQSQLQNQGVQADSFSQQQQDSGINLNQFFSSPEAIQVLLLFIFICEATFGENSMSR